MNYSIFIRNISVFKRIREISPYIPARPLCLCPEGVSPGLVWPEPLILVKKGRAS